MSNHTTTDERSLADLIRELRDESTVLLRQEVAMAKTEMSEKASNVGRNVGTMVVGGAVASLAIIFMLLAVTGGLALLILGTDLGLHAIWIAPLIVGVIIAIVALVMIKKAKATLANASLVPHKTIETLKEDKQWAQAKVQ
jgi:predicted O-methyltransferase YrrM